MGSAAGANLAASSPVRSEGWHEEDFNATSFSCLSHEPIGGAAVGLERAQLGAVAGEPIYHALPTMSPAAAMLAPPQVGTKKTLATESQMPGEKSSLSRSASIGKVGPSVSATRAEQVSPNLLDDQLWLMPADSIHSGLRVAQSHLDGEVENLRHDDFAAADDVLLVLQDAGEHLGGVMRMAAATSEDGPTADYAYARQDYLGLSSNGGGIDSSHAGASKDFEQLRFPGRQGESSCRDDRSLDGEPGDEHDRLSSPMAQSLHDRIRRLQARLGICQSCESR